VIVAAAVVGWGVHLRRGDERRCWDPEPDSEATPAAYDTRPPDVASSIPTAVDRGG
jgi:hypothetical protein